MYDGIRTEHRKLGCYSLSRRASSKRQNMGQGQGLDADVKEFEDDTGKAWLPECGPGP